MPWKETRDPGAVRNLVRKGDVLSWSPQPGMRYVVYAVPEKLPPLDVIAANGANFMAEYITAITYGHSIELPSERRNGYWYAVAHMTAMEMNGKPQSLNDWVVIIAVNWNE